MPLAFALLMLSFMVFLLYVWLFYNGLLDWSQDVFAKNEGKSECFAHFMKNLLEPLRNKKNTIMALLFFYMDAIICRFFNERKVRKK